MPSSPSSLPILQAVELLTQLKKSMSSLKVHIWTSRSFSCAAFIIPFDLLELQSQSKRSLKPTLLAQREISVKLMSLEALVNRKLMGRSTRVLQNLTVSKSNECRQIGRSNIAVLQESSPQTFRVQRIVSPIYRSQSCRYISEDLASISRPTSRPSGFLLPLCSLLNAIPYSIMSFRIGNVKQKSTVVIRPGAWSCLIFRVCSSCRVKLSVHQSLRNLPQNDLLCFLLANQG